MKIRHYLLLPAVLVLAACAPPGYEDAPALQSYYAKLGAIANDGSINYVEACDVSNGVAYTRFVTVGFDDDSYYQYKVGEDGPKFEYFTTAAERSAQSMDEWGRGCYTSKGPLLLGRYWIQMLRKEPLLAYVRKDVFVGVPFNEEVTHEVQMMAKAAENAVALHKKFVPPQVTWGGKP
jgi:hypothetical protein